MEWYRLHLCFFVCSFVFLKGGGNTDMMDCRTVIWTWMIDDAGDGCEIGFVAVWLEGVCTRG